MTRLMILVPLDRIPFVDHPELKVDKHESIEMPFRYVKDAKGNPVMPDVSCIDVSLHHTDCDTRALWN